MKTAEEILKSKLDGKITFVNNPDYTFNKVIEAMEEYRLQSHPSPMSAEQVDWESFRDKFFKQCTHNDSMDGCMINTNIEPSALFEWFKHNLPVFTTPSVKAEGWVSVEEKMTPQEQYFQETGAKTIWKITNHTHTDEYVEWIKNYAKNGDSIAAKMIREFSNKNGEQPFPRHQNKNKLHMKYQKLRRGTTLLTPITKKWSKEEMERNEETESRMIFTDFSFEDSGRSRKLVCTMNVNHPDYREYRKLIEHSTDLLKVLKDIVAISDRKHDVWDKAHELIRELS